MNDIYIFAGLSKEEISYFLLMAEVQKFPKGSTIMTQGEKSDDKAYVIKSGSVDVLRDGELVTNLKTGDIFGELALILNEPRVASIVAAEDLETLSFTKADFILLCRKSGRYEEIKDKILSRIKDNFYKTDY